MDKKRRPSDRGVRLDVHLSGREFSQGANSARFRSFDAYFASTNNQQASGQQLSATPTSPRGAAGERQGVRAHVTYVVVEATVSYPFPC